MSTVVMTYAQSTTVSPPPFELSISCSRQPTTLDCTFDFTNTACEDYYLCKRFSPLEGIRSRFLKITYEDGSNVPYRGILVKRRPAQKSDFILVKSGETRSATVQLNEAYIFEKDGTYKIEFDRPLFYLSSDEMSKIKSDDDIPSGGVRDAFVASTKVKLDNVNSLEKPRYD